MLYFTRTLNLKNARFSSKLMDKNPQSLLLSIRKNVPDNWTKIGYTFSFLKYIPNKRSGKKRIKSQIVRVTICLFKNIADYRWWLPVTYIIHFSGKTFNIFIVNGDRIIFFEEHFKRWLFVIIYFTQTSFILVMRLWYIQISGFITITRLDKSMYRAIFASAYVFLVAFLQISVICFKIVSLLTNLTPSNFSQSLFFMPYSLTLKF